MVKSKIKKFMSLFLAMTLCLSAFAGFGSATALAAGTTGKSYIVSFPRGTDANPDYSGPWGHGKLDLMNGWSKGSTKYTNIYTIDDYNGKICYCIEPGTPLDNGDVFSQRDESYWDNYPSDFNKTISPDLIKLFIGRIMQYGYTGNVSTGWVSQNTDGANKIAETYATQILVWETIVGERDESFAHVSPGSKDSCLDCVRSNHPLRSLIMSYYNSIAASVQKHSKIPSFCSKSTGKAQSIELEWNGSEYTKTLTDTNGVLSNYAFSSSDGGLRFTASGNKLTISAGKAPSASVTITADRKNSQRKGLVIWDDGKFSQSGGNQNLASYTQSVNDPVKGYVKIKVGPGDAKIVKTSEDGKIDGIRFNISGNGVNEDVITGKNGEIQIDNLAPGVYTVTEQEYDSYEPQKSKTITVVSGQTATVTFNNKLKRGDLTVTKTAEDGLAEGVKFRLTGTSLSGVKVDEYAVTDSKGKAQFKGIPVGTGYVLSEVDTANRYVVPDNQTAEIEWNKVTNKSFYNILKKSDVSIVKKDAETGKIIPAAGIGFKVRNTDTGEYIVQHVDSTDIDTYYTDNTGKLILPEKLPYGNYELIEVQSCYGYVLCSEPVAFTIDGTKTAVTVEKYNTAQKGIIKVNKSGEIFSSVTESDGIYQPVYSVSGLAGAEYEITAAEDIYTLDGTLRYEKGQLVSTIVTDENGTAASEPLYLGKFEIREIKAPYGMVLNSQPQTAELVYAGQEVEITSASSSFFNGRQRIKIDLTKVMEQDERFNIGMNGEILSVSFGLYAAEEIKAADGTAIPKDGLIEIISCDENGRAVFTADIPAGAKLYVKEYSADEHYIIGSEIYPAEFSYAGQDTAVVSISVNGGQEINNDLIRGSVLGKKVDDDGFAVCGALFGLFKADETEFTEDTAILAAKSNEIGVFCFENIPFGKWAVRELKPAPAFVLNETVYPVTISENKEIIEIEAQNRFIVGSVQTTKADAQYPENKLSGAVFEIYADADGNMEFNSEIDKLVGEMTEFEKGVYRFDGLRYNGYFLYEKTAPEGFVKDNSYHFFKILNDGETVTIENEAGVGFTNKPITGELELTKKDVSNGKLLPKAGFRIKNENGEVVAEGYTDENGIAKFFLRYGKYTYEEFDAPEGYLIDKAPHEFEITEDGQIIKAEMTNEKIPTPDVPQTGDTSNAGLWLGLGAIALGGLASCIIVCFKKKKDDDGE